MSNPQSRDTKVRKLKDKDKDTVDTYGVHHQLAPVSETVSTRRLLSINIFFFNIQSKGSPKQISLEEGGQLETPEGVTKVAGHMNTYAEKDLNYIVKQNIVISKRSK